MFAVRRITRRPRARSSAGTRQSENAGCSTKPRPPELKQKPNQSLRYKTAHALRKTLTTDTQPRFGKDDDNQAPRRPVSLFRQIPARQPTDRLR